MDVFCFELSKLFVNSGATDIVLVTLSSTAVETAIAHCTSRWAMARGHRLNTTIVLAAVHGLSVFFGRFPRSSLSLSRPLPTLSSSLIGHLASVDVKQHESKRAVVKSVRDSPRSYIVTSDGADCFDTDDIFSRSINPDHSTVSRLAAT